jgi:hypothetical protein
MVGHALWFDKCSNKFHEDDGQYHATFHKYFCSGVYGCHPHLQQDLGRALASYSTGSTHPATTQAIFQLGKMILPHGHGTLPKLHH